MKMQATGTTSSMTLSYYGKYDIASSIRVALDFPSLFNLATLVTAAKFYTAAPILLHKFPSLSPLH